MKAILFMLALLAVALGIDLFTGPHWQGNLIGYLIYVGIIIAVVASMGPRKR